MNTTYTGVAGTITNTTNPPVSLSPPVTVIGTPASASFTVNTVAPTVSVLFVPTNLALNGTTTMTISVTNPNAVAMTGVGFTNNNYPAGLTGATTATITGPSCTGTLTATTGSLRLAGGTVPPNTICSYSVVVTGTTVGAKSNSAVTVTSANAPSATTSTMIVNVYAPPTVSASFSPTGINPGGTTVLSLTLTNPAGNPGTLAIKVDNTFPSGLTYQSLASATPSGCAQTASPINGGAGVTFTTTALAAGASCTLAVNTTYTGVPGTFTNTTDAPVFPSAPTVTGTAASASFTVAVAPSVSVLFAPTNLALNGTTTMTISVTNPNAVAMTGVGFTNTYPAGLTGATTATITGTGCTGTPAATTGSLALTGGTVPANTTCSYSVVVTGTTAGAKSNSVTVTSTNQPSATTSTTTVNVYAPPTVAKAFSPASIEMGAATALTYTFTNPSSNPGNVTGIAVSDIFPTSPGAMTLSNTTVGGTCTPVTVLNQSGDDLASGNTGVQISGISLSAGQSCTVTVNVTAGIAGSYNSTTTAPTASVPVALTGVGAAASVPLTVVQASVAKTFGATSINDGGTTSLVFTLTNTGSNPAQSGLAVGDTLPSSLRLNSTTPSVTYSFGCTGPLTAQYNASTRVMSGLTGIAMSIGTATCTVTVAGLTNVATQTNTTCTPNQPAFTNLATNVSTTRLTNTSIDRCLVVTQSNATLTKSWGEASIADGTPTMLVFTLTNTGSNPAQSGIGFTESLPTGLRFTSAAPAVTFGAGCSGTSSVAQGTPDTVTFSNVGINAGTNICTITVNGVTNRSGQINTSCPVASPPAAFTNTAEQITVITGVNNGVTPQCLVVTTQSPTIAKAFVTPTIAVGGTSQINFTITNPNSVALTGANFTDTLTNMFISATGSATGSCVGASTNSFTAGQTGLITIGGLTIPAKVGSVNGSCTVSIVVQSNTPGTHSNQANAVFSNEAPPSAPSIAVNLTVTAPDLTIAKTPFPSIFTVGTNASFTLTPRNVGTSATSGVITVVDMLPMGLSYVSAGSGGTDWGCGVSGQVVTCTSTGIINAGDTGKPITINVQVLSTAVPSVTNSVTISGGGEPAANISNNSALAIVSVSSAPVNTFFPSGARSGPPGSAVFYPHTFAAGIAGTVAFSASRTADPNIPGWGVQLYRDNNCNAVLDDSDGTVEISGTPFTVLVGGQVCLIVKSNIPITAPEGVGAKDVISVTAAFTPSGGAVATLYGLVDTTTVGGGLGLVKSVKNLSQEGSTAGTSNSAKPGEVLEYEITYSSGLYALTYIVVSDQIPAYTTLVVDPLVNSPGCVVPLPNNITRCTVGGTGATITWTLEGTLSPSQTGKVSFRVKVNE